MANRPEDSRSPYDGCRIVLTTKHEKIVAIRPAFEEFLAAEIVVCEADTDQLGTFSGEIDRQGTALDCARRKCELGMRLAGESYGVASEGSFGPHPSIPFFPCDHEILYFIDDARGIQVHESLLSEKTNYRMGAVATREDLDRFVETSLFPSHALIVRPNLWSDRSVIFKGIQSPVDLDEAFHECLSRSEDGMVWVETDMRAHVNPTRMSVIGELARKLGRRLSTECPACKTPGWGIVGFEKGLQCEYCHLPTELVSQEIYGCVSCSVRERLKRSDGLESASQRYCTWCNP